MLWTLSQRVVFRWIEFICICPLNIRNIRLIDDEIIWTSINLMCDLVQRSLNDFRCYRNNVALEWVWIEWRQIESEGNSLETMYALVGAFKVASRWRNVRKPWIDEINVKLALRLRRVPIFGLSYRARIKSPEKHLCARRGVHLIGCLVLISLGTLLRLHFNSPLCLFRFLCFLSLSASEKNPEINVAWHRISNNRKNEKSNNCFR